MTQATNAAAQTETKAARAEWPQRFGTMMSLDVKSGRNGDYGIVTVDCGKFQQTAFIFNEKALEKAKAAATKAHAADTKANIWMKGPIESVQRGGFTKDEMKVVYFKDNSDTSEEPAEAAPEAAVEPQDLTVLKGIGEAAAASLNGAGIETYAALAASTAENLDEIVKGFAARANRYDWIAQAQAQVDAEVAANEMAF